MKNPFVPLLITVVVALGVISLFLYRTANTPETQLIIVKDYSGSIVGQASQQEALTVLALENAPSHTYLDLFRMGATTEEIFAGSLDDTSPEVIIKTLRQETSRADSRKGTNFAKMAQAVAKAVSASHAAKIQIRIFTDGGNDFLDKASLESYRKAALMICRDRRLKSVTFTGVKPEYREPIRNIWAACGTKLQIQNSDQIDQ